MRKFMYAASFVLSAAASTVAAAQATQPQANRPRPERAERGGRDDRGDRGGDRGARGEMGPGGGYLLKGIKLSDDQKNRLKALRQEDRGQRSGQRSGQQVDRQARRQQMQEARAAAQRGDSTKLAALRNQFQAQRAQQTAAIRAILTPEQQRQFDANVAEARQRMAERGQGDANGKAHGKAHRQGQGA